MSQGEQNKTEREVIVLNNENMLASEAVIDALVGINCVHYPERDREAFRQALLGLADLVRAEQALQIQKDMNQAARAMYGH